MDQDAKNGQSEVPPALAALRSLNIEPSPFLASRIQANYAATTQKKEIPWFNWLRGGLAVASTVALVVAMTMSYMRPKENVYALNQPYMIRMDVRAIQASEIAFAEIDLDGDSAQFASKKFADVSQKRKLVVSGDKFLDKAYLPVVVEGVKSGEAKVTVSFYNSKNEVVATKSMTLKFESGTI